MNCLLHSGVGCRYFLKMSPNQQHTHTHKKEIKTMNFLLPGPAQQHLPNNSLAVCQNVNSLMEAGSVDSLQCTTSVIMYHEYPADKSKLKHSELQYRRQQTAANDELNCLSILNNMNKTHSLPGCIPWGCISPFFRCEEKQRPLLEYPLANLKSKLNSEHGWLDDSCQCDKRYYQVGFKLLCWKQPGGVHKGSEKTRFGRERGGCLVAVTQTYRISTRPLCESFSAEYS